MKGKIALVIGLIAIIAIPLALYFGTGDEEAANDDFAAYDDPDDAAEALNGFDVVQGEPVNDAKQKVVRKMVRQPEDTLNRPGPGGFADSATPSGRVVKNVRPADGAEPGKQGAGALNKDEVRTGIDAVKPLVKACYESMLEEFPKAEGKVTVGFTIIGEGGKGRVEMSELAEDGTTLFDTKMHDCMLKSIGEAEFEVPSGGGTVSVRYPFNFENDADE